MCGDTQLEIWKLRYDVNYERDIHVQQLIISSIFYANFTKSNSGIKIDYLRNCYIIFAGFASTVSLYHFFFRPEEWINLFSSASECTVKPLNSMTSLWIKLRLWLLQMIIRLNNINRTLLIHIRRQFHGNLNVISHLRTF